LLETVGLGVFKWEGRFWKPRQKYSIGGELYGQKEKRRKQLEPQGHFKSRGAVGGSLLAQNSLAAVPTAEKPLAGMIEMHVHNEKN